MTRLQLFALRLWACGLTTHELAFALGWTELETNAFKRGRGHMKANMIKQWGKRA